MLPYPRRRADAPLETSVCHVRAPRPRGLAVLAGRPCSHFAPDQTLSGFSNVSPPCPSAPVPRLTSRARTVATGCVALLRYWCCAKFRGDGTPLTERAPRTSPCLATVARLRRDAAVAQCGDVITFFRGHALNCFVLRPLPTPSQLCWWATAPVDWIDLPQHGGRLRAIRRCYRPADAFRRRAASSTNIRGMRTTSTCHFGARHAFQTRCGRPARHRIRPTISYANCAAHETPVPCLRWPGERANPLSIVARAIA